MVRARDWATVNVFSSDRLRGNPVAVVFDDDDSVSDEDMRSLAAWTNLSETTRILPPTLAGAHYRLDIRTPTRSLPFAGALTALHAR